MPEKPLPTARNVLLMSQLRREMADTMLLAKEVRALEEDNYRLELIRKQAALTGFGAPVKTSVGTCVSALRALCCTRPPGSRSVARFDFADAKTVQKSTNPLDANREGAVKHQAAQWASHPAQIQAQRQPMEVAYFIASVGGFRKPHVVNAYT